MVSKRMFRFLNYDLIKGSAVFWFVMLIVNILSILIQYFLKESTFIGPMITEGQSISFAGSNFIAVFIFFIVYGLEMYYENFSLAIGFGGTRRNFYINVIISNLLVVILFSTIQIILFKLDNYMVSFLGYEPIGDFGLFNIQENILLSLFSLSFVLLILCSITNFIGIMQYRFSYKFWIILGVLILSNQMITNFIGRFFVNIIDFKGFSDFVKAEIPLIQNHFLFIVGLIVIISAYTIGYLFIKRANVK